MAELAVLPLTPPAKKGAARWDETAVRRKTLRQQRWRDKKRLAKLLAAGVEPSRELQDLMPGTNGCPRLSDAEIMEPAHFWARQKRAYLASLASARALAREAEAMAAMAQLAGAEGTEHELERLAAQRRAKLARLDKSLAERNPEGRAGLLLQQLSVVPVAMQGECIVCRDDTCTITPCCSRLPDVLVWLCSACVNQQALVYARLPKSNGVRRDDGGPRPIECGHLGSRCPYCRKDAVFENGARALQRLCV